MKKALVLTLAGAMIFSTPVMAKEGGSPEAVYLEDDSYTGVIAETVRAINENKTIQELSLIHIYSDYPYAAIPLTNAASTCGEIATPNSHGLFKSSSRIRSIDSGGVTPVTHL